AVRVQLDDVPGVEVERVVALAGRAGRVPHAVEVVEVPGRSGGEVLVVADRGVVERVGATPCARVHRLELRERGVVVLLVAQGEHSGEARVQQQVGGGLLLAAAGHPEAAVVARVGGVARDVARRGDHRVGTRCGGGRGGRGDRPLVAVRLDRGGAERRVVEGDLVDGPVEERATGALPDREGQGVVRHRPVGHAPGHVVAVDVEVDGGAVLGGGHVVPAGVGHGGGGVDEVADR